MGRMARVALKGLTKTYEKNVVAVDRLNLEIRDKEFVVLLGPSGCGKTTTLRCIAGLELPDDGEIYIGDRIVNDLEPKDRNVAMVFQSYALYPHMTAYQNMAFPLENAKLPEREIVARVNRTAKLLQIQDLLDRKPSQLSGGQRQRVALGRAIVREPEVFLMDEPLSNLDAKLRLLMRAELKRLQKDLGVTTIYVTHDQVEAMTMADRIALLNLGVLQQFDPPRKMYGEPTNLFVAGFVGSPPINLIESEYAADGTFDAADFRVPAPDGLRGSLRSSTAREFVLGIRPQDVEVSYERTGGDAIPGELYTTEPLGDTTILDVKVGSHLIKTLVGSGFHVEGSAKLWVRFPPSKMHVFVRKTGDVLS